MLQHQKSPPALQILLVLTLYFCCYVARSTRVRFPVSVSRKISISAAASVPARATRAMATAATCTPFSYTKANSAPTTGRRSKIGWLIATTVRNSSSHLSLVCCYVETRWLGLGGYGGEGACFRPPICIRLCDIYACHCLRVMRGAQCGVLRLSAVRCPDIPIANSVQQGTCQNAWSGAVCQEACSLGYTMIAGNPQHKCVNGQWDTAPAQCQRLCPTLSAPEHFATCKKRTCITTASMKFIPSKHFV